MAEKTLVLVKSNRDLVEGEIIQLDRERLLMNLRGRTRDEAGTHLAGIDYRSPDQVDIKGDDPFFTRPHVIAPLVNQCEEIITAYRKDNP